jgi:GTPase SAR1 family protein
MNSEKDEENIIKDKDYKFKILVLGNYDTGKSSLIKRIIDNKFISKCKFILTGNYESKKKIKKDDKNFELLFFETKEKEKEKEKEKDKEKEKEKKEKSKSLDKESKILYNSCDAVIITLDLTSYDSFRSLSYWIENIKNNTNLDFIILVGTKADQISQRCVEEIKIHNFCKNYENNNIIYVETSGKTGKNIIELCNVIIENILLYNNKNNKNNKNKDDVIMNNINKNININKEYNTFDNTNSINNLSNCESISETVHLIRHNNKSNFKKIINKYMCCFGWEI